MPRWREEFAPILLVIKGDEPCSVCDDRCYDSQVPECHCVCGGRNHGVGREEAKVTTGAHGFSMVRTYVERQGLNWPDLEIRILGVDVPWQAFTGM